MTQSRNAEHRCARITKTLNRAGFASKKPGAHDSETKLFQDALSTNPPATDHPGLRIVPDDGSTTFASVQRGVMAFAEGCYGAIRNPNSLADGLPELAEHEGLEQLAAFSLLARLVEAAAADAGP